MDRSAGQTQAFIPNVLQIEEITRRIRPVGCVRRQVGWLLHIFDLLYKIVHWRTEPLQFKGGSLTMIPMGSAWPQPGHFRGIMLGSAVSKIQHAFLRKPWMDSLQTIKPPGQLGGFVSQECGFGMLYARALAKVSYVLKKPCALIYVDLRTERLSITWSANCL